MGSDGVPSLDVPIAMGAASTSVDRARNRMGRASVRVGGASNAVGDGCLAVARGGVRRHAASIALGSTWSGVGWLGVRDTGRFAGVVERAFAVRSAPSSPVCYASRVEGTDFDEEAFFRAIERSGSRALLIGRQALIALGLPVMTSDYDFWLHIDDAALFNAATAPFGFAPTVSPEVARTRRRYVLENDERVDVLVSRTRTTIDGVVLAFDDAWSRRVALEIAPHVHALLPSLDDLILTKRFAARAKDAEDVRLLEVLRRGRTS